MTTETEDLTTLITALRADADEIEGCGGGNEAGRMRRAADALTSLIHLLKRCHGTLTHGSASTIAHGLLLYEIEKVCGLTAEAEILAGSQGETP